MADPKISFNIKTKTKELFGGASRIVHGGRETELYFSSDLHSSYVGMFEGVDFMAFLRAFHSVPDYVVFPSTNPVYSIVCHRDSVDKKTIQAIIDEKNRKTAARRTVYDHLDSSDEGDLVASKRFRSSLEPGEDPGKDAFGSLKRRMVQAFGSGCVVPVACFGAAMCENSGGMFNFRTAACNIRRHTHSSLSKFLGCCGEILDVKTLRTAYVFLTTAEANDLKQKRMSSFLVPRADPMFPYYIEALAVGIFPIRTTVSLSDFQDIFELVYGKNFERLVGACASSFIPKINSPNLQVSRNNDVLSVTVSPMHTACYREFVSSEIHEKIYRIEDRILNGADPGEGLADFTLNVASGEVFGDCGTAKLMGIADMNIPKLVQEVSADTVPDGVLYTPLWRFLRHSVNFDDKTAFFLGGART